MPVRAKAEEEEREWDEIVRVLRDMDGCGVLGARAIAIGRASDRIGIGSSGNGSGSSDARESKGARAAAEGNGGRESVWVVRVLWEEDGWVVLGARALANGIGRASLRQRQRR